MTNDKPSDGSQQKEENGGAPTLTFQIVIEFQPETQGLQVKGPMNQPIVFLGMLEMAKMMMERQVRVDMKKKDSPIITIPKGNM